MPGTSSQNYPLPLEARPTPRQDDRSTNIPRAPSMEAPMANMRLNPAVDAPDAQNEEPSHSFVAPLAQPITTTADDSDEWEYEYSTTETETFYLTLDLTTPSIPTSRPLTVSSRNGRAGFRAKWLNPGLGRRKHLLGQAPTLRVDKDKDGDDAEGEGLDEDEDAPGETDNDFQPDDHEHSQTLQSKENELREHKIQILDLESSNPLISYRDHIFTCQWSRNIGTELLFTGHEDTGDLPTLRCLAGGVDLLGACTARITSQTATLVPIAQTKPTGLEEEGDGPLVESVSAAASDERRKQARFLERLMKIKKDKGEEDEVTVVAYKRLRWTGWIELLNKRRNEEREDVRRKLRRAETNEAREALENRLKELDEEEKNMPVNGPPAGDDEGLDEIEGAAKPVKRRRKKREPVSRNEPVPDGVVLRTGERPKPVRRRPRGDWKRYNLDGTIVQPNLEAPKVPGDKAGTVWKGWHEGRLENDDEDNDREAPKSASGDPGEEEDEDGDITMGDALPRQESTGYETQYDTHHASSVVGHDFDRGFDSSPLKSSPLKRGWSYEDDDHERNADGSKPGSSRMPSFRTGQGIGFRDDSIHTPPVLSRAGSHTGIGFRDDHVASAPGSSHGVGFGDETQQHYFQGIGAADENHLATEGSAPGEEGDLKAGDADRHAPPPGGWMGLLEEDEIPHLPEH